MMNHGWTFTLCGKDYCPNCPAHPNAEIEEDITPTLGTKCFRCNVEWYEFPKDLKTFDEWLAGPDAPDDFEEPVHQRAIDEFWSRVKTPPPNIPKPIWRWCCNDDNCPEGKVFCVQHGDPSVADCKASLGSECDFEGCTSVLWHLPRNKKEMMDWLNGPDYHLWCENDHRIARELWNCLT